MNGSVDFADIALALHAHRGKATLPQIYEYCREHVDNWRENYRHEDSFLGTIRSLIEAHCPQSEKFSGPAFFYQVEPGTYRIITREERETGQYRKRSL